MSAHPWETDESYLLITPGGVQPLPGTLAMTGGGRTPPNITFERSPGSSVEFALGDGVSTLLPVVFSGPLTFETEAERALYVAQLDRAARTATRLDRQELSGTLGKSPGFARWAPGNHATRGTLTVTVYPNARPRVSGQEVDW
jgi:hypothetical protein